MVHILSDQNVFSHVNEFQFQTQRKKLGYVLFPSGKIDVQMKGVDSTDE